MAKRRKKSSTLSLALSAGAVLFAIVAVCMMFVNAVELVSDDSVLQQFSGLEIAFGTEHKFVIGEGTLLETTLKLQLFEFSFMNLLPYLLALAGGVVAVLAALGKKSFLLNVISAACFVAAAIFFFTAASYVSVAGSEGSGALNAFVKNIVDALKDGDNLKIAIGSILGGVFSAIAAVCSALKIFVK